VEAQPEDWRRVSSTFRAVAASLLPRAATRFFENKGRCVGAVVEGNSDTAAAIGGNLTIFLLAFVSSMIGYSNSPIESPFVLVQSTKQKSSLDEYILQRLF